MALLLCAATISVGVVSCDNKAKKEAEAKAALYDSLQNAEKEREAALEAQRKAEEERRKADPYMEKGWNFLRNRLKSPSTASLVGYVSPKEGPTSKLANELDISGLKVAAYEVDAQNGFGAMIRTMFYVFFRDGEPRVALPEDELVQYPNYYQLRVGLEMNGL